MELIVRGHLRGVLEGRFLSIFICFHFFKFSKCLISAIKDPFFFPYVLITSYTSRKQFRRGPFAGVECEDKFK